MELRLCRVAESSCLPTHSIVPHISWHDLPYRRTTKRYEDSQRMAAFLFSSLKFNTTTFETSSVDSMSLIFMFLLCSTHGFRDVIGVTSALIYHAPVSRLLTLLRRIMISIVHNVGFCRLHFSVQVEVENVVFGMDWIEVVLSITRSTISQIESSVPDHFCCESESLKHHLVPNCLSEDLSVVTFQCSVIVRD